MNDDRDFCYECNRVTTWDKETCTGCGRTWGHELDLETSARGGAV